MIPLARQGCVTGVVVVIIIVLVTASAYVMAAEPGQVIAVAVVVVGAAPPAALIVVLPIVGRMCAAAADAARLCDRHCRCHHHSLGHSLGLSGGGGTWPHCRSRRNSRGCHPSRRSHRRPSDHWKDVRHCRSGGSVRCQALHRESQCNPVGSQSATGRRR